MIRHDLSVNPDNPVILSKGMKLKLAITSLVLLLTSTGCIVVGGYSSERGWLHLAWHIFAPAHPSRFIFHFTAPPLKTIFLLTRARNAFKNVFLAIISPTQRCHPPGRSHSCTFGGQPTPQTCQITVQTIFLRRGTILL